MQRELLKRKVMTTYYVALWRLFSLDPRAGKFVITRGLESAIAARA